MPFASGGTNSCPRTSSRSVTICPHVVHIHMSNPRCQEHWRGHLWPSTRNANNRAKVRVGTTKRSMTAIACMSQRHTQKTFAARFECDDMLARSENACLCLLAYIYS